MPTIRDQQAPPVYLWRPRWQLLRTLALLVVVVLATALAGCGPTGEARPAAGIRQPAVEALPARSGSLPLEETLNGVVRARNQVTIRPELSAAVVKVLVRNGDRVVTGQPLVHLDDSTPQEQLRQAEASTRLASASAAETRARVAEIAAQVTRTRALAGEQLVSQLELETREAQLAAVEAQAAQAEARVEQSRALVEERRAALARTVVRAPVAGRIGQRNVEVGMVVNQSATLFLLGDFTDLIVEVPLTQGMLAHVTEGTPVEIETGEHEVVLAGISRISPFLEQSSFSTTAEIDVKGQQQLLRPGMFVTVNALYGASRQATLVPASAIWEDPQSGAPTVFVVTETSGLQAPASPSTEIPETVRQVALRPVAVLAEGRGQVGLNGVEAGEWVVTLGQHLLYRAVQTGDGPQTTARVRPTSWDQVIGLQQLQREDLLERFLAKQRAVAQVLGAEMPESIELVDQALARSTSGGPVPGAAPGPGEGG